jgi:hypothetical protein
MEFENAAQKACYEKVRVWMAELFGEMARTSDDMPSFQLTLGSAWVMVTVFPWGDDDASITARSWVVRGAEITSDLQQYLLRQNDSMRFGAFGLDKDNDIFFEHTIVGSSVDKQELKASVLGVLSTADRHDDQIRSRWGGKRGLD